VIRDDVRVVIIDDDPGVLDVLSDAVTAFGYHAFPAANAVQGLREARERRPHVILLDLSMPGSMATLSLSVSSVWRRRPLS
jgi:DNA-binding response OmpR family regulator